MADQNPVDPFKAINISLNLDGTLTRGFYFPSVPVPPSSNSPNSLIFFDVPLNPEKNTYIRVYQPPILPSTPKLPLILFIHGGGFVVFSASSLPYHDSCVKMASELPALVLSVDYRLAPENRLPSAYEDALDAILWFKTQASKCEYKFFDLVDFSKCFIMGSSSGGNITYQVGLRAQKLDLDPIKIHGLIMIQPFFGRVQKYESELRFANDKILPLPVSDLMWELALPVGADRDHEYCNPMDENAQRRNLEDIKGLPRCYVKGHGEDPLIDSQMKFVEMLEGCGVCVVKGFTEDGSHGCELFDPNKAQELVVDIKNFIFSSSAIP